MCVSVCVHAHLGLLFFECTTGRSSECPHTLPLHTNLRADLELSSQSGTTLSTTLSSTSSARVIRFVGHG